MPPELPSDPRFHQVIPGIEHSLYPWVLTDEHWTIVWVSDEFIPLIGEENVKKALGLHLIEWYTTDEMYDIVTEASRFASGPTALPRIAHETVGGFERLQTMMRAFRPEYFTPEIDENLLQPLLEAGAVPPEPIWAASYDWVKQDMPPFTITQISIRLHDNDGKHFGNALLYAPRVSAHLGAFMLRGDKQMYTRMAELYEPGRRAAAILFADLQGSTSMSRRLSSAAYFSLIRSLSSHLDDIVIRRGGIVGKHAGDGVSAFFLSKDCGSPSLAAMSAIAAAREITQAALQTVSEVSSDTSGAVRPDECFVNVGLHWGPNLYMGQVVTGGRIEVTALGDEVNECARVQQSASQGQRLATKILIEQLDDADAASLELSPDSLRYTLLSDLSSSTNKAVQDAGTLPITEV